MFVIMVSQVDKFNHYRPQTKLREGNVFTSVCDSVHRGISVQRGSLTGGSLSRGGFLSGGSVQRGTSVHGGSLFMGSFQREVSVQRGISAHRGSLSRGPEGSLFRGRGRLCLGVCQEDPPPLYGRVGGTHPTGMLSCIQ